MLYPYFTTVRIGSWRMDTDPSTPLKSPFSTTDTLCPYYAFEFYPEDMEGGTAIDRVVYKAQKNCFSLCKPGQTERMVLPNRCYYFNITTEDAMLKKALDSLPTFGYHPEMEKIFDLLQGICGLPEITKMHARLQVMGVICTVLSMLLKQTYTVPVRSDYRVIHHQAALLAANRYLQDHLTENITLEQLARESGLHPTYFHKLFTAAYGRTPMQKLNDYRISNATAYLASTTHTISEIAARCGFTSQNYFTVKFKELTGQTPTQFRKTHRKTK